VPLGWTFLFSSFPIPYKLRREKKKHLQEEETEEETEEEES